MKILLFGATGMVGQGVLRECLLDPDVTLVQTVGRNSTDQKSEKLQDIVRGDLLHYGEIEGSLTGFDACFFCLGVSVRGMTEKDYERVTFGIATAAGEILSRLNPQMTFIYVSGAGTDSSEKGRMMWARIKGKTENALLRLPFKASYMFRPGMIEALYGAQSRTPLYRKIYAIGKPVLPLLRRAFPNQILTTEQVGRAMLALVMHGYPKRILESRDIRAASALYTR